MFKHNDVSFRVAEERDVQDMRRLRNDPTTWLNLTTPGEISEEEQAQWLKSVSTSPDKRYYVILDETSNFIGIIRTDEIDKLNRSMRVGLDIVPEKRGKGYGTKAFGALIKYCFDHLNMHRLWLCVLDTNMTARNLYKKLGFEVEGRYCQAVWRDGEWHDYIVMSLLREEKRRK